MAGAYKRSSDKARGKAGKYTIWWIGDDGKRHYQAGTTDRTKSLEIANRLEAEARLVREGLVDPGERRRREAAFRPPTDHVEDYRLGLLAKGDSPRHAKHVAGVLRRLMEDAAVASVADFAPERVQAALGRLRAKTSPRTANHALGCLKAFAKWLEHNNRIREVPRGLVALRPYSEEVGRKRVRRALTTAELTRLLGAAESGGDLVYVYGGTKSKHNRIPIDGRERAALYRLAMGTGFRANELRSLTPESFRLDGDEPTVTVEAAYSKNGKRAVQPITKELAAGLRGFVEGKEPGRPVLIVPDRTAQMLRVDLARAGIPYEDERGRVLDFHALRGSYITHLIQGGANPKVVQTLARHSTITLTMDIYCKTEDSDLRKALENKAKDEANGGNPSEKSI